MLTERDEVDVTVAEPPPVKAPDVPPVLTIEPDVLTIELEEAFTTDEDDELVCVRQLRSCCRSLLVKAVDAEVVCRIFLPSATVPAKEIFTRGRMRR